MYSRLDVIDMLDFFLYETPADIYTGSEDDTELFTLCVCVMISRLITIIIVIMIIQSGF